MSSLVFIPHPRPNRAATTQITHRVEIPTPHAQAECFIHSKRRIDLLGNPGAIEMQGQCAWRVTSWVGGLTNWDGSRMAREDPADLAIYRGARVILTKNLNKEVGFVNGMQATVLGMENGNVIIRTDQGRRLAVHPWTSENRVAHFPMRLGYASTLHKVQGATLKHITLWLDTANVPAAAYVALSRVEYDANWRFVGDPCVHHFTPAMYS